jgi:hypothetical protein
MPVTPRLATVNFTPAAVALLIASAGAAIVWAIAFVIRFATSFPALPRPGPETSELGRDPEPPAIANLLVNRCNVTSAAAAATLIDLVARRHLDLSEVGPERFVVRLRSDADDDPLTGYEQQVITLVLDRATGGSAPLEAIELDESQASGWRDRFAKSVVADAKARGLLRGRWTRADWIGFGLLAAVALLLLAAGLYVANVHESAKSNGKSFGRQNWFFVALAAWLGVLAVRWRRSRSTSKTPTWRGVAWAVIGIRCTSSTRRASAMASARSQSSSTECCAACSGPRSHSSCCRSSSTSCGRRDPMRSATRAKPPRLASLPRSQCSPRCSARSAPWSSSGWPTA